uniref:Uncharacterized protein n=1 Tax=viral metagenome TaxID=1070528 RepID=A0A6M3L1I1_9ZZZZ
MTEKTDHDKITEIHAVLLGVNGNPGIAQQVARNSKSINRLWIAVIVLGSSVGGGVYGIINLLR